MTELEARTLCVDIDLTLCVSQGDYAEAEPIEGAREALQALRKDGWKIVLFTARHFNHWQMTVDWLARFGFLGRRNACRRANSANSEAR